MTERELQDLEEKEARKREAMYGHEVRHIQCQTSASHTFGNVTAFVQNWLLNLFPEGLFKTIHVNSKIAHAQLRSTPNEFLKKSKPMFIIRPRIDWTDTNKFLKGTPIAERQGDLYHTYGGTNLQDFFQDNRNKVAIKWQLNRTVMNFDVILIFGTFMQQSNWANHFINSVRQERPFTLETCLESYLAPDLLREVSKCAGIPTTDEDGSHKTFLRYLNSNSKYPITYKLQGGTGREEFYRYYPVNMDCIITNFSPDEGEKVGHVSDKYQIPFTMRCEFTTTGFYYLFSDNLTRRNMILLDEEPDTIVPVFTDVLTKDDIDLPVGWHLFASPSCRLETKNDSLNIETLFTLSLKTALKFHVEHGMPLVEFFNIRIRKQGKLLTYGEDFTFDPETYTIHFINCNTYYTYKILIMINVEYINNLIKSIYKLQ